MASSDGNLNPLKCGANMQAQENSSPISPSPPVMSLSPIRVERGRPVGVRVRSSSYFATLALAFIPVCVSLLVGEKRLVNSPLAGSS